MALFMMVPISTQPPSWLGFGPDYDRLPKEFRAWDGRRAFFYTPIMKIRIYVLIGGCSLGSDIMAIPLLRRSQQETSIVSPPHKKGNTILSLPSLRWHSPISREIVLFSGDGDSR